MLWNFTLHFTLHFFKLCIRFSGRAMRAYCILYCRCAICLQSTSFALRLLVVLTLPEESSSLCQMFVDFDVTEKHTCGMRESEIRVVNPWSVYCCRRSTYLLRRKMGLVTLTEICVGVRWLRAPSYGTATPADPEATAHMSMSK